MHVKPTFDVKSQIEAVVSAWTSWHDIDWGCDCVNDIDVTDELLLEQYSQDFIRSHVVLVAYRIPIEQSNICGAKPETQVCSWKIREEMVKILHK